MYEVKKGPIKTHLFFKPNFNFQNFLFHFSSLPTPINFSEMQSFYFHGEKKKDLVETEMKINKKTLLHLSGMFFSVSIVCGPN